MRTPSPPAALLSILLLVWLSAFSAPAHAQNTRANAGARPAPDQQVILVTGSTDGLGREVARRLAAGGAHVIVHGRNRERGAALVAEIEHAGAGSARFYPADLAALADVRTFADAILRDYDRLDVLVNNAGIWLPSGERRLSADGHELHFAVNYLAGYLLTRLLLPLLIDSAPARIINVASAAQTAIDFDDPMLENGYSGGRAYAQSKLAQVLFTIDLARELDGHNVIVAAVHPATLMDTPMVREAGVRPRSSVAEGADAVMQLVTGSGIPSGAYYDGLEPARPHAQARDDPARAQLRRLTEALLSIGRGSGIQKWPTANGEMSHLPVEPDGYPALSNN